MRFLQKVIFESIQVGYVYIYYFCMLNFLIWCEGYIVNVLLKIQTMPKKIAWRK